MSRLPSSAEETACRSFLDQATDEKLLQLCSKEELEDCILLAVQGFEERSVGVLELLASQRCKVECVVVAGYAKQHTKENELYRERMENAANAVSRAPVVRAMCYNDGSWVKEVLQMFPNRPIMVDITGVSNRAMFSVLDAASAAQKLSVAYTEALEYWPTQEEWDALKPQLLRTSDLAKVVDKQPWLFGSKCDYELLKNYEGYDSASVSRALLAFLPFKAARLAAVIREEYAMTMFIGGRPHLASNAWRFDALLTINKEIIANHTILEMPTFGYREVARRLIEVLLTKQELLLRYDVHLAPLGSKLQEVACWLVCRNVPGITVLTGVPKKYYPKAFSRGVGNSYFFQLPTSKTAASQ